MFRRVCVLSWADKIKLGSLQATGITIAIQNGDDKGYGPGVDGCTA